jgi:hypothetical protein
MGKAGKELPATPMPTQVTADVVEEIRALRKERNAVILAHHYQESEIQEIADAIGDSLELARKAKVHGGNGEDSEPVTHRHRAGPGGGLFAGRFVPSGPGSCV